ncbi:MAG: Lrp/AsnC family transcriptional regulator [Blastocatellia bacterium]
MTLESEKLLDEIGWHIVEELQANARLSYAELGRRVGLSIPAVTERVRRLEDAGIITGYHAQIDFEKIGRPILAFVRMSIMGDAARLSALLREMPEVIECHRGTGGDSFILKVSVASVHHLETLIDSLLPYGMTTTSIVLSSPVVRRFAQGPREEKKSTPPRRGR